MLEEPEFLILRESKVRNAFGNHLIVLLRRLHDYQTVVQASEHVDSLFVLKIFDRRRILKQDSKAVYFKFHVWFAIF